MRRSQILYRLLSGFNQPDGEAIFSKTGSVPSLSQSASKPTRHQLRRGPTLCRSSSDFVRPSRGLNFVQRGPVYMPLTHRMCSKRCWNEQGPALVSIVVGFQAARWRGNIFQDGLGTWRVPKRKQAHKALTTQRFEPLATVVRFYTA